MSARPRDRVGRLREALLALAFLAVWIVPPFWGLATLSEVNVQDDIFTSDLLNDRLPARAFVGASLRGGDSPFWMPGIYTGFPALAQVEVGTLYPSNLVLFGLLDPWTAIAFAQLLPLFLAGFGAGCLARALGLDLASAALAAGTFGLCGFLVAHFRQLNMVDAAAWVPWLLLAAERLAAAPGARPALALAVAWALQLLAGHPQISYFTALVLVAYLPIRAAGAGGARRALRASGWAAAAAVAGSLAAAAQLVPTIELARQTYREGGLTLAQAAAYAAPVESLVGFVAPGAYGDPGDDSYRLSGIFWEHYGYAGVLPVLLALVALVVERRSPAVRTWAGIALVCELLVLGPATPLHAAAFHLLPGMSYFRFPTRFLVFVELAIALLAAFGLRHLRTAAGRRGRALGVAVLAVTALDLGLHQSAQVPLADRERWTSPPWTATLLLEEARRSPEPWRYVSLDAARVHGETFHQAGGWRGDLEAFFWLRGLLQPSSNLLHGLESADGYANLVPHRHELLWGSEKKPGVLVPSGRFEGDAWRLRPGLLRALRAFNVHWVLAVPPLDDPGVELVRRDGGIGVYRVREPFPRAFVVGKTVTAAGADEALAAVVSDGVDLGAVAVVEPPGLALPPDAAPSRSVRVVSRGNVEMVVEADLEHPGLLVVSEAWYPGWTAEVDGRPATLHRANVLMRAVELPAGRHRVRFVFESPAIRLGFGLSALGLALLGALAVAGRRGGAPA